MFMYWSQNRKWTEVKFQIQKSRRSDRVFLNRFSPLEDANIKLLLSLLDLPQYYNYRQQSYFDQMITGIELSTIDAKHINRKELNCHSKLLRFQNFLVYI